MTIISTFYKEDVDGRARAEVVKDGKSYRINFYDPNGVIRGSKWFPGKNIQYVENIAEDWTMGIRMLHE